MTSPTDVPPPPQPGSAPPATPPGPPPATAQPGWGQGWDHRHRDDRRGAIIGGVVLVLLGAAFLAQEFVPDLDIGRFWPVILIVIGILVLASAVRRQT